MNNNNKIEQLYIIAIKVTVNAVSFKIFCHINLMPFPS